MSLETALQSFQMRLAELDIKVQDLPPFFADHRESDPLVDDLDDVVTALVGATAEALTAVDKAIDTSQPDGSLDAVYAALGKAHEALNGCTAAYVSLFVPPLPEPFKPRGPEEPSLIEKLLELERIDRERLERKEEDSGQWVWWGRVVRRSIGLCAPPLYASAEALTECWHELAVRLSRHSISVQATNIGQQISVREDRLDLIGNAT